MVKSAASSCADRPERVYAAVWRPFVAGQACAVLQLDGHMDRRRFLPDLRGGHPDAPGPDMEQPQRRQRHIPEDARAAVPAVTAAPAVVHPHDQMVFLPIVQMRVHLIGKRHIAVRTAAQLPAVEPNRAESLYPVETDPHHLVPPFLRREKGAAVPALLPAGIISLGGPIRTGGAAHAFDLPVVRKIHPPPASGGFRIGHRLLVNPQRKGPTVHQPLFHVLTSL